MRLKNRVNFNNEKQNHTLDQNNEENNDKECFFSTEPMKNITERKFNSKLKK